MIQRRAKLASSESLVCGVVAPVFHDMPEGTQSW
jgi:hypothetical protein